MAIELNASNELLYLVITLLSSYALFRLKINFDIENLIDSLIRVITKFILFFVMLTFLICFIVSLAQSEISLISYLQDSLKSIIELALWNYIIFGSIKLIYFLIDFFKKGELLHYSFYKEAKK